MTGVMAVGYDIGFILISMYVTFVMAKWNVPRVIAGGFVVLGIGSLLFSMPHFLTPDYVGGQKLAETCPFNTSCDSSEPSSTSMQGWIVVFILAQLLHGFGSTPLYTIGFAFLEESTDR